jgi:3-deoxy-D-manno-octulosonic-acid transferase
LFFYPLGIRIASLWNEKAQKWLQGRQNWQAKLLAKVETDASYIWVHCASLGEFEQGRPIIEAIKQQQPNSKIVLTFFSPSGYEVRKNYTGANIVCYLPIDSPSNARHFLDCIKPSLVIFVKYEFWFYYLKEVKQRQIPLLLVSGIFRSNQTFFKAYGSFNRQMLSSFSHFFLQNDASGQLLSSIGFTNYTVCGDTRFDRVVTIAQTFEPIDTIETFINNKPTIVAGSTWTEDDEEIDHFANTNPNIKFIIAPHNIIKDRIEECLTLYKNAVTFSAYAQNPTAQTNPNVLIIDNVGMLSRLYKYATICYVGGGFGDDGVHNVLEAAVYYKPVVFGPVYDKFIEAEELEIHGGGFSIDNALELENLFSKLLTDNNFYQQAAEKAGQYVASKTGATAGIMKHINAKSWA